MRNTRSNVFLQSMKTNPLSVKKLMKKLILTTLRELYVVSEISLLIQWVTPPTKVENLQFEFFLSFSNSSTLHCLHSFRGCFSNRSASHDNSYLFTHDLTRSPPLSTWVAHVNQMRRARGTFVRFLRVYSFSLHYKYPLLFLTLFLLRSFSLPLELLKP